MELRDRVVLVTGASSGIGAAVCRELAAGGARLVLAARRESRLREVAVECGGDGRTLVVATDVGRHDQLQRLVDRTVAHFGQLDVLINNAGIGYGGESTDITPEEIEHLVRINLLGPLWLTRLALPHLAARDQARIVNVASMSAVVPLPGQSHYCASKLGLSGFGLAMRREVHGTGIRVVNVYPGSVDSEMNTAELRRHMADRGLRVSATSAEWAAARIVRATRKGRKSVYVATIPERIVAWIEQRAPWMLDRLLAKMRPAMLDSMRYSSELTRAKRSIS